MSLSICKPAPTQARSVGDVSHYSRVLEAVA
jgi:hypothetical protein